jgi:hypothetical protein
MNFSVVQLEPLYLLVPILNIMLKFPDMWVYFGVLGAITLSSCRFVVIVMCEMADFLNVRCFWLKDSIREALPEDKGKGE